MNNPKSPLFCPNGLFVGCFRDGGMVLRKEGFIYVPWKGFKKLEMPLGTPVLLWEGTIGEGSVAEAFPNYWRWPGGYVPSWIEEKNT